MREFRRRKDGTNRLPIRSTPSPPVSLSGRRKAPDPWSPLPQRTGTLRNESRNRRPKSRKCLCCSGFLPPPLYQLSYGGGGKNRVTNPCHPPPNKDIRTRAWSERTGPQKVLDLRQKGDATGRFGSRSPETSETGNSALPERETVHYRPRSSGNHAGNSRLICHTLAYTIGHDSTLSERTRACNGKSSRIR